MKKEKITYKEVMKHVCESLGENLQELENYPDLMGKRFEDEMVARVRA